jgi:hypothetical protein
VKKIIYSLGAICLLLASETKAQINFQPATAYYGMGTNTRDITSGDFNGDGNPDIAITNTFNHTYSIFTGSSTGTFSNTLNSGALAYQPSPITSADFNNDSKIDLSYADLNNSVYVKYGTGVGTFTGTSSFGSGSYPLDIISADFNNDGKPDLATSNQNNTPGNITVALASTTGTFATATNFTVGAWAWGLTAGDFNSDGNKDIAVTRATTSTGTLSILFGDGTGSFGLPVNYTTGNSPQSVSTADFNGDGNLDIAVANYADNNITILLGSSTGTFAAAVNYATIPSPTSISCVDIDGDFKIDLAVANGNSVSILKGSGTGTFVSGFNFSIPAGSVMQLTTADFNSDGKIDIAVTNYNGMSVLLNSSVCTATISVNSGTICSGQSFTIVPSGASTYTFSSASAVVSPTTSTNFTVTGTTLAGCVGSAISSISVVTSPTINTVSSSVSNLCSGNSTNLSVSGWAGPALSSYTWSNGSNTSSITVSPTVTTTYSVSVTNTLGCISNQFAYTQTVNNCVAGTAFNFDGVDDYINTGTGINNVLAGTNKITIEAWIRAKTNQDGIIVSNIHTSGVNGGQFQIRTRPVSTGQVYFDFFLDNSAGSAMIGITAGAASPFNINEWHHIAATWDGTVTNTYIDGTFSNAGTTGTLTVFQSCVNNLLIGARTNTFPAMFNGDIDDLRIWNRVLCADEINHVKNGELPASYYPDLIAYYKFNQGVVGGNNFSTNSSITNAASSLYTGLIMGTPLTGTVSNFVSGNTAINTNTVSAFTSTCQVANSINEVNKENSFSVYPNPVNDFILVKLTDEPIESAKVIVINALGEIILTETTTSSSITLKTEKLINGIYFVKVESKNGSAIKKFIKQ